jgi:hypothetical protein
MTATCPSFAIEHHTCPIPMQDGRWKNLKAIGHSICQMDQMDLQFSIGHCVSIGSNGQMECPLASNGSIGTMHHRIRDQ